MTLRVAVDIGGTFTDVVFLDEAGTLEKLKVPSTPADYSEAILTAVERYCEQRNVPGALVEEIVHATTVATNAVLERTGARTALVTTQGFRDVLELRRVRVPLSYDFFWEKPRPLVERARRFEVVERCDAQGNVQVPLQLESVQRIVDSLSKDPVEAVAVCLLHAYRQPKNEQEIARVLKDRFPGLHVSLSSQVLPEIQEFERTSTTVVNAYLAPLVAKYLESLRRRLKGHRIEAPILVMQSNGGLISSPVAASRPVTIIESGPAAGVVGAARLARECGYPNVLTLDMGGTTSKASIIEEGQLLRGAEYEIGAPISVSSRLSRGNGYLLRIPVIDISEVGAGGGSIARLDSGGALRVGPRSAGAFPGPSCYGLGNDKPTVTDANLVLGYLGPSSLAGGSVKIDPRRAEASIATHLCEVGNLTMEEAAYGIHLVANSNMVRAIKSVSTERGRDPADFVLIAFGGAGPIHAAGIAGSLGIAKVLIPPSPGVFSAHGLLHAAVEHHAARTLLAGTRKIDFVAMQAIVDEMRETLVQQARDEGYASDAITVEAYADMRYAKQSSEMTVPFDSDRLDPAAIRRAEERFEEEFERAFGHRGEVKAFELVTFRLVLSVARGSERLVSWAAAATGAAKLPHRDAYFGPGVGRVRTPVIRRHELGSASLTGPLIIEEYDSTIVIPPNSVAALDPHFNVLISFGVL